MKRLEEIVKRHSSNRAIKSCYQNAVSIKAVPDNENYIRVYVKSDLRHTYIRKISELQELDLYRKKKDKNKKVKDIKIKLDKTKHVF